MTIRMVMLGDVVGRAGRLAVAQAVPKLREQWKLDLVIANAENASNGDGLTPDHYQKLCAAGVDAMTLGDHAYRKMQIVPVLEKQPNLIRPANLSATAKGRGWMRVPVRGGETEIFVITVLGRLFMSNTPADDPFACVERILRELPSKNPVVLVEIHAETTSEKQAMGWHFNGRVSAVIGTHTHVQTADARILGKGTAYLTDLGMSGSQESVLGRMIEPVLTKMTTGMPAPFDPAEGDPRVCGVFIEVDEVSRRATAIERIELKADVTQPPFTAAR
jgi:metallophosphoesterase (TIGR00282 family)